MCAKDREVRWGCGVTAPPGVGVTSDGRQYVFYRGSDRDLYETYYEDGGWNDVGNVHTRFDWGHDVDPEAPGVGIGSGSHQYVFFTGSDGDIYEAYYADGHWNKVGNMADKFHWGGTAASGPGVAVNSAGQYVFYRKELFGNFDIFEAFYQNGTWTDVGSMWLKAQWGHKVTSGAGVAANDTAEYVFFAGDDFELHEAYYDGDWHNVGSLCASHHFGCGIHRTPAVGVP